MNYHPASNIFPMMDAPEFLTLKRDIETNGLIEPIWMYEDQILDGRNRYKACEELDLEPQYRHYTGESPASFVVSLNLARRHLNQSQLAIISVKMLPILEKEARSRAEATQFGSTATAYVQSPSKGTAAKEAADLTGASERYVYDAKKIMSEAPEEIEKIESGEKTITQVKSEMREPEPDKPKSRGKGLNYAHEAIAALKRIPKNDGMRQSAFDEVINWIKTNRGN